MEFLQEIMNQIGAFFTDTLGAGFANFIDSIVKFVNSILDQEARF